MGRKSIIGPELQLLSSRIMSAMNHGTGVQVHRQEVPLVAALASLAMDTATQDEIINRITELEARSDEQERTD